MDRFRTASPLLRAKRAALPLALVLLVVGGGVTMASIDFTSRRVDREMLRIETVQRGTLEIKVAAQGRLLSKNIEQLGSQVTGRVSQVLVRPGDRVETGQLLVEITNPQILASAEEASSAWQGAMTDLQASEAELQTNLLNQRIVLTQAQFELERAQLQLEAETKLIGQKIISDIDYRRTQLAVAQLAKIWEIEAQRIEKVRDNIEVRLAVQQARVTQLARALDRAQNDSANLRVVAGIEGVVQAVNVEVGQQLQPGSPIGRIAQQDRLYAELKVPAREASELKIGQQVIVDMRNRMIEGTVTRIDPGVTDGTVIVDAELPGRLPSGARPQLQVEGIIYISRLQDTLYVGRPSYAKADALMSVYKLDPEGRYASRVNIRAGRISLDHLQIVDGLQAGDRIITSEIHGWQDQQRIYLN